MGGSSFECPCGQIHELSPYEGRILGALPPDVLVRVSEGSWYVPRIYLAKHGLKAVELPGLAERYGFAELV